MLEFLYLYSVWHDHVVDVPAIGFDDGGTVGTGLSLRGGWLRFGGRSGSSAFSPIVEQPEQVRSNSALAQPVSSAIESDSERLGSGISILPLFMQSVDVANVALVCGAHYRSLVFASIFNCIYALRLVPSMNTVCAARHTADERPKKQVLSSG